MKLLLRGHKNAEICDCLHVHKRVTTYVSICKVKWSFEVHNTFLELHSKTELQHSPYQLHKKKKQGNT